MIFWHGVLIIGTALQLVVPGAHLAMPAMLSLAGLFLIRRATALNPITDPKLRASWSFLLCGFAAFALSSLLLNIFHGDMDPGAYERFLPFILLPALAFAILSGGWSAHLWIAALGISSVLAGAFATWEFITDPNIRAEGATGNAIKFGNGATLLFGLCTLAALFFPFPNRARIWRVFLVVSATMALVASLLSGSKGGWPVILMVAAGAFYLAPGRHTLVQRHFLAALVVALVILGSLTGPAHLIRDRVHSGVMGAVTWFQTGGDVTDSSVSLRFELWHLGWRIFSEKPLLGAGIEGKTSRWSTLATSDPDFSHIGTQTSVHNDLIEALAHGGVLGAFGQCLAYVGVWFAFWRWRNDNDEQILALSRMGLILVPAFLIFGLSVSLLAMSFFRTLFVTYAVVLLSFISVRRNELGEAEHNKKT